MKFAIPITGGKLADHFGHCENIAFIKVDENKIKNKEVQKPPPHKTGVLPQWLHENGVNIVIAHGMGRNALGLLGKKGIKVITGICDLVPEDLVMSYLADKLKKGANICDH